MAARRTAGPRVRMRGRRRTGRVGRAFADRSRVVGEGSGGVTASPAADSGRSPDGDEPCAGLDGGDHRGLGSGWGLRGSSMTSPSPPTVRVGPQRSVNLSREVPRGSSRRAAAEERSSPGVVAGEVDPALVVAHDLVDDRQAEAAAAPSSRAAARSSPSRNQSWKIRSLVLQGSCPALVDPPTSRLLPVAVPLRPATPPQSPAGPEAGTVAGSVPGGWRRQPRCWRGRRPR